MLIQDVALKTYQERWTIETGGERGSGRSVLAAQHDDDDDNFANHYNCNVFDSDFVSHLIYT